MVVGRWYVQLAVVFAIMHLYNFCFCFLFLSIFFFFFSLISRRNGRRYQPNRDNTEVINSSKICV